MDFSLVSSLNIDYPTRVDYVEVDLSLYPREVISLQNVNNLVIISEPETDVIKKDNSLYYKWRDLEEKTLKFGVSAKVTSRNDLKAISNKVNFPILSKENLVYTAETEHIDFNEQIRAQAKEITKGETDLYFVTYKLAEWVKANVKYDLSTLTVKADKKSTWVFENKRGVCDEITNLFISFLRTLGIPSRFVFGVVYSNVEDKWGNHGWAEVYFPDYGWVPFDVTFGQYGWIDASHIKLKDSLDSGEPSVKYSWKSSGADITAKDTVIETTLIEKNGKLKPKISLDVEVLKDDVGFGSFSLVEVTLKNLNPYYIPTVLYFTKAPLLIGENTKRILLKPNEEKKVFWIITSPINLEKGYTYKSIAEVKSIFGAVDSDRITFSEKEKVYSLNEIEERLNELIKKEEKTDFDFNCILDKTDYYKYETAKVDCSLKNEGSTNFERINVCLENDCRIVDLLKYGEMKINFNLNLIDYLEDEIVIEAKYKDETKKVYLEQLMLESEGIKITDIDYPKTLEYNQEGNLTFYLYSDEEIKNFLITVYPFKKYNLENFKGSKMFILPFKGKDLDPNGEVILDIFYDSRNVRKKFNVEITNMPWYGKIKMSLAKLFRVF
ncbi:hypothetical protein CL621_02590 [archaeon]|nr:hypothetical protein [archaeon]|tara:strand:- start:272 stop:2098 length:1827 start_codon:yes stop_codon:yes gene_type:complete